MSKKIDAAHQALVAALEKHAEAASGKKSKRRKIEAAAAEVKRAAITYARVVSARTDTVSPFADIPEPRLDAPTVESLRAERDALALRRPEVELTADDLQVPLPAAKAE